MGYYMHQMDSKFEIKVANKVKALEAIRNLMGQVDKKGSGGSMNGNGKWKEHYSWVGTEEVLKAETLEDAMKEWRWDVETDRDGNIDSIMFDGEKLGDDMQLFSAIAPFVEKGSFIEMSGDDAAIWRWVFKNGECLEKFAKIVYDE